MSSTTLISQELSPIYQKVNIYSLNPDSVIKTRLEIAQVEARNCRVGSAYYSNPCGVRVLLLIAIQPSQ
jgi:hypothetical protein